LLWHLAVADAEAGQRLQAILHAQAAVSLMREMGNPKVQVYGEYLDKYRLDGAAGLKKEPVAVGGSSGQPGVISAGASQAAAPAHGPGLLRMALSAAKSLTKFVGSGMKRVPVETREKRLATCASCPHHTGVRCKLCGCGTVIPAPPVGLPKKTPEGSKPLAGG
jgi:hypothetical protein